jgi:hypothetical protein
MKHTITLFKKILSAIFILTIISCGSAEKFAMKTAQKNAKALEKKAERSAKNVVKQWKKQGFEDNLGKDIYDQAVSWGIALDEKDEKTGYNKNINAAALDIRSKTLAVAKQEATDFIIDEISVKIGASLQRQSDRDVNNTDGEGFTKYLATARVRCKRNLGAIDTHYSIHKKEGKYYFVRMGATYNFKRALDIFEKEMMLELKQESEDYQKRVSAYFDGAENQ